MIQARYPIWSVPFSFFFPTWFSFNFSLFLSLPSVHLQSACMDRVLTTYTRKYRLRTRLTLCCSSLNWTEPNYTKPFCLNTDLVVQRQQQQQHWLITLLKTCQMRFLCNHDQVFCCCLWCCDFALSSCFLTTVTTVSTLKQWIPIWVIVWVVRCGVCSLCLSCQLPPNEYCDAASVLHGLAVFVSRLLFSGCQWRLCRNARYGMALLYYKKTWSVNKKNRQYKRRLTKGHGKKYVESDTCSLGCRLRIVLKGWLYTQCIPSSLTYGSQS